MPFLSLIEQISREANLDIYMVDKNLPERVNVNINGLTVEDALRRILNGHNYAVVYSTSRTGGGTVYLGQYLVPYNDNRLLASVTKKTMRPVGYSSKKEASRGSQEQTGEENINSVGQLKANYISNYANDPDGSATVQLALSSSTAEQSVFKNNKVQSERAGNTAWSGSTDSYVISKTSGSENSAANSHPTVSDANTVSRVYESDTNSEEVDQYAANNANNDAADNASSSFDEDIGDSYEENDLSSRERFLLTQIHILESQIESGYADRWYDHWTQIKEPKYIQTHDDKLAYYQGELEKLRSQ